MGARPLRRTRAKARAWKSEGTCRIGNHSDFLLPVVFGVILGTGIIYGLTAKPVAQRLGVTQPPPTGVGLVGSADWLVQLARRLQELGASVLVITDKPPDVVQAEAARTGVPTVSVGDTEAKLRDTVRDVGIAQVAVCAPSGVTMNLVTEALLVSMGRRRVLRLPDRQASGFLGSRVPERHSATPSPRTSACRRSPPGSRRARWSR